MLPKFLGGGKWAVNTHTKKSELSTARRFRCTGREVGAFYCCPGTAGQRRGVAGAGQKLVSILYFPPPTPDWKRNKKEAQTHNP